VTGGEALIEQVYKRMRVVIILDDPGPVDFLLDVADMSQRPTITVIEVADGNNQLRSSVADYRPTITPVTVVARTGGSE
jgi:hypothetical protein